MVNMFILLLREPAVVLSQAFFRNSQLGGGL
jgi:hypothetical protein